MGAKLTFRVNLSDPANEFQLSKSEVDEMSQKVVNDVTRLVLRNIKAMASQELGSTRAEYVNSLKWIERGRLTNAIVLMGKLPNMIESGASPYDMKQGFSASSKIKHNKAGGWYLTIPFRWATPTALGENPVFSAVLPNEVYQAVKDTVGSSKTALGGSKMSGGGLSSINIPEEHAGLGSRAAISDEATGNSWEEYQHKTNIYEGITQSSKTYESAGQSQYVSFRRVGANSDPMSWIHKGIRAHNFFDRAMAGADLDTQVDNSVDEFLHLKGF